jgi:hypothetical protein
MSRASDGPAALGKGFWSGRKGRIIAVAVALLVALTLRATGLRWGLDRGFHPDEIVSMLGVGQIDLLSGDFSAPAAYFEGTFNYYLWSTSVAVIKIFEDRDSRDWTAYDTAHWRLVLFISRCQTVFLDILTGVVIFLIGIEATGAFFPSLTGALIYSIIPMEVIYAHFMRPHVLCNFWYALALWLSIALVKRREWWLALSAGLVAGLAMATHYPMGVTIALPCLFLLFAPPAESLTVKQRIRQALGELLTGPLWWIIFGFLVGLLVGEPAILFDLKGVIQGIAERTLPFVRPGQFRGSGLFNFDAIWKYLSFLIPHAMWPTLWIVPYAAIIFLLARRCFPQYVFPLLIFSALYLYPMAKGYYLGVFARATMFLFPGLCVLTILALHELFNLIRLRPLLQCVVTAALILLALPAFAFDCAYVRAMRKGDPRSRLRDDLRQRIDSSSGLVGVSRSGGFFYTVMPAVRPLESKRVKIRLQTTKQPADYFLVGFTAPLSAQTRQATIQSVEQGGRFTFRKSYSGAPKIFGIKVDMSQFPTDMTYPFCEILVFRPAQRSPSG